MGSWMGWLSCIIMLDSGLGDYNIVYDDEVQFIAEWMTMMMTMTMAMLEGGLCFAFATKVLGFLVLYLLIDLGASRWLITVRLGDLGGSKRLSILLLYLLFIRLGGSSDSVLMRTLVF